MWEFANNHPVAAFFIAWVLAWAFAQPFAYAASAYNRKCRSRNIAAQGWPSNPNMDADGDLVFPKCECDEDEK